MKLARGDDGRGEKSNETTYVFRSLTLSEIKSLTRSESMQGEDIVADTERYIAQFRLFPGEYIDRIF